MTVEKFYETLNLIVELDEDLQLQTLLNKIATSLGSLVSSPNQPPQQSALAGALEAFSVATQDLKERLTPSQVQSISEVGGEEFFDPAISEKVKISIATNAMTPSVAHAVAEDIQERREGFLKTVNKTLVGLGELGVTSKKLMPGTSDLAFVIPRELFDNHLGPLAKELTFISRLMEHVSEAVTGKSESAVLEGLSSSVPTIALYASAKVIEKIADIVNKFLEAWERVEKIRKMRAELKEMGLKGTALNELTEEITTTINEVVEESTRLTMVGFAGENVRKHELENALRQDAHRLFGQIERGLTIQFRAAPSNDANEDEKKALETVDKLSRTIKFPPMIAAPMLLESGEILEGEIFTTTKITKKTTTTKGKRASSKDAAE